jgi:putative spermidine/putrescine transport system substrate-binding protein
MLRHILTGVTILAAGSAGAQEAVTFSGNGGAAQDALRAAFFEPAAATHGLVVNEDTHVDLSPIRLQVQSGAVTVDVVSLGDVDCAAGAAEGLFEPLDLDAIDTKGLPDGAVHETWVPYDYFSTVLGVSTALGDKAPKTWADFWNVKDFPGRRALFAYPHYNLEFALLADGVAPGQLYPMDLDRAFRKLAEIKPDVTAWWESGAQSAQLALNDEVDMLAIWNGRLNTAIDDGAAFTYSFDNALLSADCLAVPKGAPHKAAAMKLINIMLKAELQAEYAKIIGYGPANLDAAKHLDAETLAKLPSSPENFARQVEMRADWWAEHIGEAMERWGAFMQ